MKKIISSLLISLMSAVLLSTFSAGMVANAGVWDDIKELVSSGDQNGADFTQFKPTEDLTLAGDGFNKSLTTEDNLKDYIIKVVNFALGFLGLIAVVIVIYGGFLYVTAGGQEEQTQTGKKAITYATIGLLIIMGSFAFVNTIIQGASGGENDRSYVTGGAMGNSFNASASQVRNIAREIYSGFLLLAESGEELKGIVSDLGKPQLSYTTRLVDRNAMLNVLSSAEMKLRNVQTKVVKFSSGYSRINDLLRYIDNSKSRIQNAGNDLYARTNNMGEITTCTQEEMDMVDGGTPILAPTSDGGVVEICGDDFVSYPMDLVDIWNETIENLAADENNKLSIKYIFEPLKQDFIEQLLRHFAALQEIKDSLAGIQAVDAGDIGKVYEQMRIQYGYDESNLTKNSSGNFVEATYTQGILKLLQNWVLYYQAFYYNDDGSLQSNEEQAVTEEMGGMLLAGLEKQFEFADLLEQLKSVEAHLRANVINGNAPLIVTFDVVDSVDPAGGTTIPTNIKWNLTGAETFEGEDVKDQTLNKFNLGTETVECDNGTYASDQDTFGTVFRQCTFKRPGTYVATVTINSNDPTKYVSGMSSIIIKVNPPTNKVNLNMTVDGAQSPINIISYYDNGLIKNDQYIIPVTLDEASNIRFDAHETKPQITNYKWDFGNGKTVETDASGIPPAQEYKTAGKYRVVLEVINELGELDQKVFTIDVRDVAARISVSPTENIVIEKAVLIDGRQSATSSGKIKLYEWKVTKTSGEAAPKNIELGSNKNKSSFNHIFKEPGKYQIDLTATSELETVSAQPFTITVASKKPTALFDYKVPDPSQPSTYHFGGSKSFDPDGDDKNLVYKWSIEPDQGNGKNWILVGNSTLDQKNPKVKFLKENEYAVTLKVTDKSTQSPGVNEEFGELTKKIDVENVLDAAWNENMDVTAILDDKSKAVVNFKFNSVNAIAYDIDFGDGEKSNGDLNGSATVPHTYTKGGKFNAEVVVYDKSDNETSLKRTIFIGGGKTPIARAELLVNGVQMPDLSKPIEINKEDILTFDASSSKNLDGTGRGLSYSWDFGDTDKSSNKTATHSYSEVSPKDPGYFLVTLSVFDKDDPNVISKDELKIKVLSSYPTFSSIQAVPETQDGDLITPVAVNLKAFNPDDKDGQITQYKWWYFDVDDPDEPLGIQVTQAPVAKLIIGTSGKEGQQREYGFGLEITDSDNLKTSSMDLFDNSQIPTIEVENGPNDLPVAKFSVNSTKVFTGDEVTFTSSSKDKDGKIVAYIWDFEGDGFFNDKPTKDATVEHVYKEQKKDGYSVRLKVRDDKGGESVSDPIKVYVETLAAPPTAAFKFEVIEGSGGKKIKFINNSKADEKAGATIIGYKWDYDTESQLATADSDGDSKKDNDSDSTAKDPERLFAESGTYTVKLTVTDNQGSTDSVTHTLITPLANPPTAAFTYSIVGGKVAFKNNSTADSAKGAKIEKYIWDFDTESQLATSDADGDGDKTNDSESTDKDPSLTFPIQGEYKVKLTVIDNYGNIDDVVNKINTSQGPNLSDTGTPSSQDDPTSGFGLGEQGGTKSPASNLVAVINSNPAPAADGIIYISGDKGTVIFDFTSSVGSIADYTFDKNIYFDTDKNGINHDDKDFKTPLPGTWTTNFEKAWGKIVVKLTVKDIYGNENTATQEIKFK